MSISRTIARPLLASTFFIGATNALKHSDAMAHKAESVTDKLAYFGGILDAQAVLEPPAPGSVRETTSR